MPVHFQRDLRIHAWIKPFLGVGEIDFGAHIARLWIQTQGEAGYGTDERLTLEAVWLDDGRIADVKVRHVVLRHIAKYPDRVDPLHGEKWRCPCARGGLDQIAPVYQPPRPSSIQRRPGLRQGEQGFGTPHRTPTQIDLG